MTHACLSLKFFPFYILLINGLYWLSFSRAIHDHLKSQNNSLVTHLSEGTYRILYMVRRDFYDYLFNSWSSHWLSDGLIEWFISWSIDWLIDWLIDWSSHSLIDWSNHSLIGWLINWLIDWLANWLIKSLIGWLIDWSSHSLIG